MVWCTAFECNKGGYLEEVASELSLESLVEVSRMTDGGHSFRQREEHGQRARDGGE